MNTVTSPSPGDWADHKSGESRTLDHQPTSGSARQGPSVLGQGDPAALRAGVPDDPVNHPRHYRSHPSGIECIEITEHLTFCIGNAMKYLWRAGEKDTDQRIQDLRKSAWYIQREIQRLKKGAS